MSSVQNKPGDSLWGWFMKCKFLQFRTFVADLEADHETEEYF
jgi:hypothetical protein